MQSSKNKKQTQEETKNSISAHFKDQLDAGHYELAFRRWLVRELNQKNITSTEAIEKFKLNPKSGHSLLHDWTIKYTDEHELSLPQMTSKEKTEKQALEKRIKELEKQVDKGKMHVIALNTIIDIAEENLNIKIRKKPGTKQ